MSKAKPTKAETVAKKATGIAVANPTLVTAAIVLPIGLYLIYKIGKKIDNVGTNINPGTSAGDHIADTSKANLTKSEAQLIASNVYNRIVHTCLTNKCLDEMLDDILDILKPIRNMSDYGLVSNAYGKPRFDGYAEAFWPFPERNMTYWLQTKFRRRPEKYNLLKQIIPSI